MATDRGNGRGEGMYVPHVALPGKEWRVEKLLPFVPVLFIAGVWLYDRAKTAETIPNIQQTQIEHTQKIAVLEERTRQSESRYAEIISRIERMDNKLDRALSGDAP